MPPTPRPPYITKRPHQRVLPEVILYVATDTMDIMYLISNASASVFVRWAMLTDTTLCDIKSVSIVAKAAQEKSTVEVR